jgi:phosphatidylinositol kinase/protein kinase (PI-3  family)
MGLLRENKDTLMTVLDPFIHDPLVEWEDEKRKIVSGILEVMTKLSRRIATGTINKSAACP